MRKILLIISVLAFWFTACGQTTKRIDQLPIATTLSGLEVFPLFQSGVTKKITWTLINSTVLSEVASNFAHLNSGNHFLGDQYIAEGMLSCEGGFYIGGNSYFDGDAIVGGTDTVRGDMDVEGSFHVVGNTVFDGNNEFAGSTFDYGATFEDACNFYNMPSTFWMGFTSHQQTIIDTVYIGREYLRPTIINLDGCSSWGDTIKLPFNHFSYIQITGGEPLSSQLQINSITAGANGELLTIEYDGTNGKGIAFAELPMGEGGNIKIRPDDQISISEDGGSATFRYSRGWWRLIYSAR